MLLPELRRRKTEFLFEGPVEAGVIAESILLEDLIERNPGEDSVFACLKPLFQHILVQGDSHMILKNMGDMILAYIEEGGEEIQAQIFFQMVVDIIADIQVEYVGVGRRYLMAAVIEQPVHMQKKIAQLQVQAQVSEGMAAPVFFDQLHQESLYLLKLDEIGAEMILLPLPHIVKGIGEVGAGIAELFITGRADPEYKTPVRHPGALEDRAVGDAGRNQQVVPIYEGVGDLCNLIVHIPLEKKIEFIIIMPVRGNMGRRTVVIIENLKITVLHILAGVEACGQFFFHEKPPLYCCYHITKTSRPQLLQY